MQMTEAVNHPQHYNKHPSGVECIDVVEGLSFNLGNAVKYLWRAGFKADLETDLRKAHWYLRREIAHLKALASNYIANIQIVRAAHLVEREIESVKT
jgi:hypothetical protein